MLKVVFKLDLHDDKEKMATMKLISGFAGVDSIDINMKDKKLTVCGAMDPVELAEKLRKLFPTEIVSVGLAKEEKKDDKKKDGSDKKKDDNKGNQKELPKDSKPDPPTVYPFPYGLYKPPPPPPTYYYGYGGYVSVEENRNACVIC